MTRDEVDKLIEVLKSVPDVSIDCDWKAGTIEIMHHGLNTTTVRTFTVDPPAQQTAISSVGGVNGISAGARTVPTIGYFNTSTGAITITLPTFTDTPTSTVPTLKCVCGADKCGGLHSSWCEKKN